MWHARGPGQGGVSAQTSSLASAIGSTPLAMLTFNFIIRSLFFGYRLSDIVNNRNQTKSKSITKKVAFNAVRRQRRDHSGEGDIEANS